MERRSSSHRASFEASYELDLWGKLSSASEAARQRVVGYYQQQFGKRYAEFNGAAPDQPALYTASACGMPGAVSDSPKLRGNSNCQSFWYREFRGGFVSSRAFAGRGDVRLQDRLRGNLLVVEEAVATLEASAAGFRDALAPALGAVAFDAGEQKRPIVDAREAGLEEADERKSAESQF